MLPLPENIKDYEELLERAEHAEDVAWLKKARRTPLQYRPLGDYVASTPCRSYYFGNEIPVVG
jgi:hypothetical protein